MDLIVKVNFMLWYVMLLVHVMVCYGAIHRAMPLYVTLHYITLCDMRHYGTLCFPMVRYVIVCYATLWYIVLSYATTHHTTLHYVMLNGRLCYTIVHNVMIGHVIVRHVIICYLIVSCYCMLCCIILP